MQAAAAAASVSSTAAGAATAGAPATAAPSPAAGAVSSRSSRLGGSFPEFARALLATLPAGAPGDSSAAKTAIQGAAQSAADDPGRESEKPGETGSIRERKGRAGWETGPDAKTAAAVETLSARPLDLPPGETPGNSPLAISVAVSSEASLADPLDSLAEGGFAASETYGSSRGGQAKLASGSLSSPAEGAASSASLSSVLGVSGAAGKTPPAEGPDLDSKFASNFVAEVASTSSSSAAFDSPAGWSLGPRPTAAGAAATAVPPFSFPLSAEAPIATEAASSGAAAPGSGDFHSSGLGPSGPRAAEGPRAKGVAGIAVAAGNPAGAKDPPRSAAGEHPLLADALRADLPAETRRGEFPAIEPPASAPANKTQPGGARIAGLANPAAETGTPGQPQAGSIPSKTGAPERQAASLPIPATDSRPAPAREAGSAAPAPSGAAGEVKSSTGKIVARGTAEISGSLKGESARPVPGSDLPATARTAGESSLASLAEREIAAGRDGAGVDRRAGRSAFQDISTEGSLAAATHLPARSVAVGIDDPAHGWIEVRARGGAGQVVASLTAATPEAHAALRAQLPAMAEYLAEREIGVRDLAVSAGERGGHFGGGGNPHGGGTAGQGLGNGDNPEQGSSGRNPSGQSSTGHLLGQSSDRTAADESSAGRRSGPPVESLLKEVANGGSRPGQAEVGRLISVRA